MDEAVGQVVTNKGFGEDEALAMVRWTSLLAWGQVGLVARRSG